MYAAYLRELCGYAGCSPLRACIHFRIPKKSNTKTTNTNSYRSTSRFELLPFQHRRHSLPACNPRFAPQINSASHGGGGAAVQQCFLMRWNKLYRWEQVVTVNQYQITKMLRVRVSVSLFRRGGVVRRNIPGMSAL